MEEKANGNVDGSDDGIVQLCILQLYFDQVTENF